jgi:acyl carrier protein
VTTEEIERVIAAYLVETGVPARALANGERLFTGGYLDSMQIVHLIVFLEDRFSFSISPLDISLDHFDVLSNLVSFVADRTSR